MLSLVNHGLSAWGEEGPSGHQVISFPISHLKICVVGRWDDPPTCTMSSCKRSLNILLLRWVVSMTLAPPYFWFEAYISIKSRTMLSHVLAVYSHHKKHWLLSARSGGRLWFCGFWVKIPPGYAAEKGPPGWWWPFGPAAHLQIKCPWAENSGSPSQPRVHGLGLEKWE